MSPITTVTSAADAAASRREFLAFTLGAEEYGIAIQAVQELRRYDAVTAIANAPACLKGVVNLRGSIVPIIDLRIRFGVADPDYDQFTVVIVVHINGRIVGLVADSVSDVIAISADQVKPAPSLGATVLVGIGLVDQRMLLLLDIDALMGDTDFGAGAALAA